MLKEQRKIMNRPSFTFFILLFYLLLCPAGKAAHWAYKEKPAVPAVQLPGPAVAAPPASSSTSSSTGSTTDEEGEASIAPGHPMLHIGPGEKLESLLLPPPLFPQFDPSLINLSITNYFPNCRRALA
jgi:hypothetical protein